MTFKILQVALDLLELKRAVEIGKESIEGGADWLEVGTPLIKSEGMNAIRTLRDAFPDVTIVADMKTMDTGAIEVEMAAKSGASVVSILAVADNAVIDEAIKSGRKYGVAVMVDLINVEDPVRRAKELEGLGVDYVCVHVGIDQQMQGMDTLNLLKKVSAELNTPLAVAGGVDAELASEAVSLGADVIIVGGNITRSAKVKESTAKIRESMDLGWRKGEGRKERETLDTRIFKLFMQVSTPNISDAMHRKGVMRGIKPLFDNIKLVGKAVVVQTFEGDWAKPVEATDVAKEPKGFGELNAAITCGGQEVEPGDWIIGDDNGVVVVPKARAYEIARRAKEVWKNEERVREEIKRGKTLSQVLDLYVWEKK